MFDNSGSKIKTVAKIFTLVSIIGCLIGGFHVGSLDELSWLGVIMIVFGPFMVFFNGLLLYGFGELISKITEIESRISSIQYSQNIPSYKTNSDTVNQTNPNTDVPIIK